MKHLLFIIAILFVAIAFSKVTEIKKKSHESRGLTHEPIIFEVEVLAPCEKYLHDVLNNIQISRVSNPTCLPISTVDPTLDVNDRSSHIFCTNIHGGKKSIFRFHEIFEVSEDETPVPGEIYIVSWTNKFPFVESSRSFRYMRRPACSTKRDLCSTTDIVKDCYNVDVNIEHGYVHEEGQVYFIPGGVDAHACTLNNACCPYVNTLTAGICGGTGGQNACTGVNCDDLNACTIDICHPVSGCSNCPVVCNDNNACTDDSCDPASGCVYTQRCNDNDGCTIDSCDAQTGTCSYAPKCDDGRACTVDSCDAVTGVCTNTISCDDNDACTIDSCDASGNCQHTAITCNDNVACTTDSCDPATGCVYTPNCDDSNACTTDSCNLSTGLCVFTPKVCNDGNPCTNNFCDPATGSCYFPSLCLDNNGCTEDECTIGSSSITCNRIYYCDNAAPCNTFTCTDPCLGQPIPCAADYNVTLVDKTAANCQYTDLCEDPYTCNTNPILGSLCCSTNNGETCFPNKKSFPTRKIESPTVKTYSLEEVEKTYIVPK